MKSKAIVIDTFLIRLTKSNGHIKSMQKKDIKSKCSNLL